MSVIDQDWVRDAIERHSDAAGGNGRDFHNGAYAAIADELADVQPPYSQLLALLRDKWHIDCSWDGLRQFWNVELTDEGVSERAERDAAIAAMLRPEVTQDTSDGHTPDQAIERIATLASRRRKTYTKEYCNRCDGAVLPGWDKCPWCGAPLVVDE